MPEGKGEGHNVCEGLTGFGGVTVEPALNVVHLPTAGKLDGLMNSLSTIANAPASWLAIFISI